MTENGKEVSSSLKKVREGFDPAYSYVIFEKPAGASLEDEFQEVVSILMRLNLIVHDKETFLDSARAKWVLVVKMDRGRADEIMQEFVSIGLPEDISFYAYGSQLLD